MTFLLIRIVPDFLIRQSILRGTPDIEQSVNRDWLMNKFLDVSITGSVEDVQNAPIPIQTSSVCLEKINNFYIL